MKTRITELFGIEYPIVQGAMQWLSKPNLAAAVSNAGGLGTINMTTYADPEDFQKDIQRLKRLTDKPFSVNLSLLPDTKPDGPIKGFLQAIVDEINDTPMKVLDWETPNEVWYRELGKVLSKTSHPKTGVALTN